MQSHRSGPPVKYAHAKGTRLHTHADYYTILSPILQDFSKNLFSYFCIKFGVERYLDLCFPSLRVSGTVTQGEKAPVFCLTLSSPTIPFLFVTFPQKMLDKSPSLCYNLPIQSVMNGNQYTDTAIFRETAVAASSQSGRWNTFRQPCTEASPRGSSRLCRVRPLSRRGITSTP